MWAPSSTHQELFVGTIEYPSRTKRIINMREISLVDLSVESLLSPQLSRIPILFCVDTAKSRRMLQEASFQCLSLNLELSKRILEKTDKTRPHDISFLVREIIEETEGSVLLTNYEMLFDPRYQLDVIRLFVDLARNKQLAVECNVYLDGNSFQFSEPGYDDYHRYDLARYAVVCVR